MNKYIVYAHTFPNGKRYVGITGQSLHCRFRNNGEGYKGQFVYNAILKYGWHNVKHEILYENLTLNEAEEKEICIIREWNTTNRLFGYNRASGGKVNVPDDLSREKNRAAHIGKNKGPENPFFGKKHKFETRLKMGKKVLCTTTNTVYNSLQEAENMTGILKSNIYKVCRGYRKTAGGMGWKYES